MTRLLSFGHLNVRSLVPHFGIVRDLICSEDFDVFAVTETWLNQETPSSNIHIPNYTFLRRDRVGRGGGTGLYINVNLNVTPINSPDDIEQTWARVTLSGMKIAVGSVYRPPRTDVSSFINNLESTIVTLLVGFDSIVLMGDFNINLRDTNNGDCKKLNSFLLAYGLIQIVKDDTRVTSNGATLIDHIIISEGLRVQDVKVTDMEAAFDHSMVSCKLPFEVKHLHTRMFHIRTVSFSRYLSFQKDLEAVPWHSIYYFHHINDKLRFFNTHLLKLINLHFPEKKVRVSNQIKPWITYPIREMIKARNKARKKFDKSRSEVDRAVYVKWRNFTNSAIDREKRAYFNYKTRNHNSRDSWKLFRQFVDPRDNNTYPINLNNPNEFNKYFIGSVPVMYPDYELFNYYVSNRISSFTSEFTFNQVSELEVLKVINTFRSNAVGVDQISMKFIMLSCPFLLPFITHITNFCLQMGVFPDCWKEALIIPIPKTSNPSDYKHYRPISILSALSKIVEKIAVSQIKFYLDKHAILPVNQSGFRAYHSCTTALLKLTDDIYAAMDNQKTTALVLLDFSKAFDTISHNLLYAILHYIGFSRNTVKFFTAYLQERSQRVKLDKKISENVKLRAGVPQGSIFGPILFIIYTSVLSRFIISCQSHYYADDSQIYLSYDPHLPNASINLLNKDLDTLREMCEKHCLALNPDKSVTLYFGRKSETFQTVDVAMNNVVLPVTEVHRNLGLMLSSDLKFEEHVSAKIKTAYCILRKLYPYRTYFSVQMKRMLCDSLVLSHFNYCDVVYGSGLNFVNRTRIQKVQNACVRFICGLRKFDQVSRKLCELQWLNMDNRRKLSMRILFYKILKRQSPPYLYEKITFRTDVHNVNVRNRNSLHIPRYRTANFRNSYSYNIAHVWNSLSDDMKKRNLSDFRKQLIAIFLSEQNLVL